VAALISKISAQRHILKGSLSTGPLLPSPPPQFSLNNTFNNISQSISAQHWAKNVYIYTIKNWRRNRKKQKLLVTLLYPTIPLLAKLNLVRQFKESVESSRILIEIQK
jgi:hypothetical protein